MIIRKPYAFLIKNFKKIHIVLLILSLFVAYKLFDVNAYVNEFIRLGTYDFFGDPISRHISIWLNLALLLLVIGSAALLFLLHYKKKPWKIYLVPIVEYLVLMFVLSMIRGFFNGYSSEVETTDVRLARDLLVIFAIVQVPAIGIFIMRVFGLDMKKFQFNSDAEFLELSEEDREEFEIGLNFDKRSLVRGVKRFLRNAKYVYLEHKTICISIVVILFLGISISLGRYIFITNKSYSQGDNYSVNGYTFRINHAYYTDKDFNGNVIADKSSFVIIDISIKNNAPARTVYFENFHIRNGTDDYVTTNRTYAKEFQDLGVSYETTRKIKRDEEWNCIIIYKVNKTLKKNKFVLYYQEKGGILRKIKLNIQDISHIENIKELNVGDDMDLGFKNQDDVIRFDFVRVLENVDYTVKRCGSTSCQFETKNFIAPVNSKIVEIRFNSSDYEAKNMIDFLKNYGKLNYRDSEDEEYSIKVESPILESYSGKSVYLKVPAEVEQAKELYFDFILRNKHFKYVLLGGNYEEEGNG